MATSGETRNFIPISRKKIYKKTLAGSRVWFLLIFFSLVLSSAAPKIPALVNSDTLQLILYAVLAGIGISVCMIVINYFYQKWYFHVYFYELTSEYATIKKGPVTSREITIPYEHIQHVYIDRDLFDRVFGLYDVHLSGPLIASGAEAHIDGFEKKEAEKLKALITELMSRQSGKPAEHIKKQNGK